MSLYNNNTIGKAYVGNRQIGQAFVGDVLVYTAESDPITLSETVKQSANSMNWGHSTYTIEEDWETLTVLDSVWGKSYGSFQTMLYLVDGETMTPLVERKGGYGGHSMPEEPIVESGTQFTVKKGQKIRLSVGASYNPDVSGSHETTSWITFKLS